MQTIAGTIPWASQPLPKSGRPKRGRPALDQSPWLVIHDPSGDFQGRRFRLLDLQYSDWPEGTIFWHALRGEVRVWRGGQYQTFCTRGRKGRKA